MTFSMPKNIMPEKQWTVIRVCTLSYQRYTQNSVAIITTTITLVINNTISGPLLYTVLIIQSNPLIIAVAPGISHIQHIVIATIPMLSNTTP